MCYFRVFIYDYILARSLAFEQFSAEYCVSSEEVYIPVRKAQKMAWIENHNVVFLCHSHICVMTGCRLSICLWKRFSGAIQVGLDKSNLSECNGAGPFHLGFCQASSSAKQNQISGEKYE